MQEMLFTPYSYQFCIFIDILSNNSYISREKDFFFLILTKMTCWFATHADKPSFLKWRKTCLTTGKEFSTLYWLSLAPHFFCLEMLDFACVLEYEVTLVLSLIDCVRSHSCLQAKYFTIFKYLVYIVHFPNLKLFLSGLIFIWSSTLNDFSFSVSLHKVLSSSQGISANPFNHWLPKTFTTPVLAYFLLSKIFSSFEIENLKVFLKSMSNHYL